MLALVAAFLVSASDEPSAEVLEQVTFAEAVDRSLSRNPTLATALEEINRAHALVEEARAALLPQLTGTGAYLRLDHDRVLGNAILAAANQLNATLTLSVPVLALRSLANTQRAGDNTDVVRKLADDTRRLIALSTGRAFLTIVAQHRVVEVTERARDVARVQLAFTEQRYQGGVGNRLDVTRSGQELATAEALLQNNLAALTRAREALGVLMGSEEPMEVKGEPNLTAPESVDWALKKAVVYRADVVADRRKLEAAEHSSQLNWTEYMPTLGLFGNIAYQNPPTPTLPLRSWQVQVLLTIPFYDGGLRYGLAHERSALEREAHLAVEGTVRQARAEVRTAFDGLRRAELALQAARDASRLAGESLKLAELAYRTGVSTNLELVDAQQRARDADTAAAVAEDNDRQSRLDLLSASGSFP